MLEDLIIERLKELYRDEREAIQSGDLAKRKGAIGERVGFTEGLRMVLADPVVDRIMTRAGIDGAED